MVRMNSLIQMSKSERKQIVTRHLGSQKGDPGPHQQQVPNRHPAVIHLHNQKANIFNWERANERRDT